MQKPGQAQARKALISACQVSHLHGLLKAALPIAILKEPIHPLLEWEMHWRLLQIGMKVR
jgi:hypothetical protein